MPTIFFNIAWMKHYEGETENDSPRYGGSYETKHEVCNFLPVAGRCYGYVQPQGDGIALEKIGADPSDEFLDGVTVVWCARSPNAGHTVIVGYYRNARLYRTRQKLPPSQIHEQNQLTSYFAECAQDDKILLSHKRRAERVPRGKEAMGQSLIWYGEGSRGEEMTAKVADFLKELAVSQALQQQEQLLIDDDLTSVGSFDEGHSSLEDDFEEIVSSNELSSTEKVRLIRARIGQGKFRKDVLERWRNGCAVTGCRVEATLRASHIKAWRDCANPSERLDPDNGLILCATLDALFDQGLISFKDNGEMLIDPQISEQDKKTLSLGGSLQIRPSKWQARYLKHHRETYGYE